MNIKKGIGFSGVLVALDQIIKLLIYNFFMSKEIRLLGRLIYFSPKFNKSISWASSKTGISLGLVPHIMISILVAVGFIACGILFYHKYGDKKYMRVAYWITLSGVICSIIDRIFWGSSLDYIRIKGFFIFDLKDIFIDAIYVLMLGIIIFEIKNEKR